jgi:hypothetical protein
MGSQPDKIMKLKNVLIMIGISFLLIVVIIFFLSRNPTPAPVTVDPNSLPGIQTENYPWPPEIAHLRDRLAQLHLPALTQEGTALHIHQHLDIFVDGIPVPVPADVGIDVANNFLAPIHIHDTTGIIHIESPVVQDFTLGQFFDIWGLRFTADCLGAYCTSAAKQLVLIVNGQPFSGNFRSLVLAPHQEIVVSYGNRGQLPSPLPGSYTFPPDY